MSPAPPVASRDPRTALLLLAALCAAAMALRTPQALLVLVAGVLLAHRREEIPLQEAGRAVRPLLWLFTVSAGLQAWAPAAGPGHRLREAVVVLLRLAVVAAASRLVARITPPARLGEALGRLLAPLRHVGLPVADLATACSVGLQFLPLLGRAARDTRDAQVARGLPHRDRSPLARLRAAPSLLVPLLSGAVHRADRLALAMANRGYRPGAPRGALHPLGFSRADLGAAGLALAGLWTAAVVELLAR